MNPVLANAADCLPALSTTLPSMFSSVFSAAGATLAQAADAAAEGTAQASSIGLRHYLTVSALVFSLGLMVIVMRRNAIAVLMGIELMLNAAGLNFVAFGKFVIKDPIDGQVVTLFVIVLAAAEAALALGIVLNIFNNTNSIDVDEVDALKG